MQENKLKRISGIVIKTNIYHKASHLPGTFNHTGQLSEPCVATITITTALLHLVQTKETFLVIQNLTVTLS